MRALVLWDIAKAYQQFDQTRADVLSKEAFTATLLVEDGRTFSLAECFAADSCRTKQRLQREILQGILSRSPALIEELLPNAEVDAQRIVADSLITEYTKKKRKPG
jgi:hypothetical protein